MRELVCATSTAPSGFQWRATVVAWVPTTRHGAGRFFGTKGFYGFQTVKAMVVEDADGDRMALLKIPTMSSESSLTDGTVAKLKELYDIDLEGRNLHRCNPLAQYECSVLATAGYFLVRLVQIHRMKRSSTG